MGYKINRDRTRTRKLQKAGHRFADDSKDLSVRDLPVLYGDLVQIMDLKAKLNSEYGDHISSKVRNANNRLSSVFNDTLNLIVRIELEEILSDKFTAKPAMMKELRTQIAKTASGFIARQSWD